MKPILLRVFLQLLAGRQARPTVIMLSSSLLICLWRVFGSAAFYTEHLSGYFTLAGDPVATAAWYSVAMCALLLGLSPLALARLLFRESPSDYGVRLGDLKIGLLLLALSVPVILLISYFTAPNSAFRAEYPINRHAGQSSQTFAVHAVVMLFFYLGWEFHFRGFLQFGLARSMGRENSLGVQVVSSCLAHLGKPPLELLASIPAGVFWGVQAYRTHALWTGVLQHWLLGVSLDYFICFHS